MNRRAPIMVAALLCGTLAVPARAWPVDKVMDLEAQREQFVKLSSVDWVQVEDPKIASAEILAGSSELMLTGLTPGKTLLLLYAEGNFAVWRLRVQPKQSKAGPPGEVNPVLSPAEKVCPELKSEGPPGERTLTAKVPDETCRAALLQLLKTDAFRARDLDLTFEPSALQSQLRDIESAIATVGSSKIEARYYGAGLTLRGALRPGERAKVLWQVFFHSAGKPALDDQLVEKEAD